MLRFLNQPLLHFLLAGALFFALYSWIGGEEDPTQTGEIFITPDNRKQTIDQDVQELLAQLNSKVHSANVEEVGDRIMLDSTFESKSQSEIDRLFGSGFGMALTEVLKANYLITIQKPENPEK